MKKENKALKLFKKVTDSENSIKRLPFYFFLICVLLVVLIFKLNQTNQFLGEIAANGTASVDFETLNRDLEINDNTPPTSDWTYYSTEESTTEGSGKNATSTSSVSEKESEKTTPAPQTQSNDNATKATYVINKNSKKIHKSNCTFVSRMKDENKLTVKLTKEELNQYIKNGYTMCSTCGG